MPSRVLLTIASSDEETMAASCADSRTAAEYRSVVSSHGIGATPLHLRYLLSAVADIDAKFLAARLIRREPAACTGNDGCRTPRMPSVGNRHNCMSVKLAATKARNELHLGIAYGRKLKRFPTDRLLSKSADESGSRLSIGQEEFTPRRPTTPARSLEGAQRSSDHGLVVL